MARRERDILERAVRTIAEQAAKADELVDEAKAAGGGDHPVTVHAKMLRLELLKVKADLERELEDFLPQLLEVRPGRALGERPRRRSRALGSPRAGAAWRARTRAHAMNPPLSDSPRLLRGIGLSVRTIALSVVICAATTCTSGDATRVEASSSPAGSPTAASPTTAPSTSPVATPPPKPRKPSLARLEGTYTVKFTLVRTNVSGADPNFVQTYIFQPNCARGPCTTKLTTRGPGGYSARTVFVQGRYRWARVDRDAYTCDATATTVNIPANKAYVVQGTNMKLVNGQWVITRFTGQATFDGTKGGGCFPVASERYILKGTLRT
jgi:hypothetical protein